MAAEAQMQEQVDQFTKKLTTAIQAGLETLGTKVDELTERFTNTVHLHAYEAGTAGADLPIEPSV